MTYAKNKTTAEHCVVCQDDGIVTLKGTLRKHGYTYSRGSAPCKWCEQGTSLFVALKTERREPASSFTLADVELPNYDPPASKSYANNAIAEIATRWGRRKELP